MSYASTDMSHDAARPNHLAHHFDNSPQQYESAKLGMWVFIATEILMFGGLFVAYAVYRSLRPDIFAAGGEFLSIGMGAFNTAVLLCSSFTMAWAVRAAQLNQRTALIVLLSLTFCGGVIFLGVKTVEYKQKWEHGLMLGNFFNPEEDFFALHDQHDDPSESPDHVESKVEPPIAAAPAHSGNTIRGKMFFAATCAACHGDDGAGLPDQGADLLYSNFVNEKNNKDLLTFLKIGRQSWDADSVMKLQMPPRGGNPALNDEHLTDIIAYLRELQDKVGTTGELAMTPESEDITPPETGDDTTAKIVWSEDDIQLLISRSIIQLGNPGPKGINPQFIQNTADDDTNPLLDNIQPAELRIFFTIYFLLTGLHAIHIIIGMTIILWLIKAAIQSRFNQNYYTPVDIGGLYWHLVDLIWIFLFPLLYLI